jgi:hypothetical protein
MFCIPVFLLAFFGGGGGVPEKSSMGNWEPFGSKFFKPIIQETKKTSEKHKH